MRMRINRLLAGVAVFWQRICYAGDIDGDGFQDLVVSHSDIDADASSL